MELWAKGCNLHARYIAMPPTSIHKSDFWSWRTRLSWEPGVRAGQLTCLNLLSRLPSQHQAYCLVRMYAWIKEKFSSLLPERLDAAKNFKCEWRGPTWTAFLLPSLSNNFVVLTSQNKSFTRLDAFLLILFLQIFRIDFWWNLGIFFRKKHHKPIFRFDRTRVDHAARDAEIKIFSALRWLVVSDMKWRHQITWIYYVRKSCETHC